MRDVPIDKWKEEGEREGGIERGSEKLEQVHKETCIRMCVAVVSVLGENKTSNPNTHK